MISINLDKPRLKLSVKHDIKSKNFKASTSSIVVRKAGSIIVLQSWMRYYKCLDNNVFNIRPNLFFIVPIFLEPFVEMRYFPEKKKMETGKWSKFNLY